MPFAAVTGAVLTFFPDFTHCGLLWCFIVADFATRFEGCADHRLGRLMLLGLENAPGLMGLGGWGNDLSALGRLMGLHTSVGMALSMALSMMTRSSEEMRCSKRRKPPSIFCSVVSGV
jgi:hypothetical protein